MTTRSKDPVHRPLALTMGDPAGIGPDITLLAFEARRAAAVPPFVLLGDATVLAQRATALGLKTRIEIVGDPSEALACFPGALPVLPIETALPVEAGCPDSRAASAVLRSIEHAVALTRAGTAAAVVTNPIAKAVLYQGGFGFPGHTEFLAHLAGLPASDVVMMLAAGDFRVVPVTIHMALRAAIAALNEERIVKTLDITARGLAQNFGIARPRIAVTGLNPHAGEDGAMGREEIDMIAPAINAARAKGLDVSGPYPADTLFHAEARKTYDVAVAMYHDQALIPLKTVGFDEGVNVTLGLPFIRTSPDHGTAFAIAGTGKANPRSLIEALLLADVMRRHQGRAR